MISRLLRRLDDPTGAAPGPELHAFRFLVLVHVAVQAWAWVLAPLRGAMALPREGVVAAAVWLTLCSVLAFTGRARWAPVLALPALCWQLWQTFPGTANHQLLACGVVALLAALDPAREDEGRLLLQALCWTIAVVFFHAGLQKLLHGTWLRGEFLAWMIAHGAPAWEATFAWLLPPEEVARLQGLDGSPGSGPYRVAWATSPTFVLFANAVWVGEMGLAVLLFVARTRVPAAICGILVVLGIQLAPRELMFALLASQLFLLHLPGRWNRRLLVPIALAYAYLLFALAGWVPGEVLLKPNGRI